LRFDALFNTSLQSKSCDSSGRAKKVVSILKGRALGADVVNRQPAPARFNPARNLGLFRQVVDKQGNLIGSACGNARDKGIVSKCTGFWKETPANLQENPEPNSASKEIGKRC
jgi:hypothetical protein